MPNLEVIAHARNGFHSKFGVPRQTSQNSCLITRIVFEPQFRQKEALRGIEEFSHLWLIWGFTDFEGTPFSPTVRPPRLGGNTRVGVFATRSPNRPNHLALSSVRLIRKEETHEGIVLVVQGADMTDGTPIYDIKPYIPYTDAHHDATGGFTDYSSAPKLSVNWPEDERSLSPSLKAQLTEILSADPRPQYHDDPDRIYGLTYDNMEIKFSVSNGIANVRSIEKISNI